MEAILKLLSAPVFTYKEEVYTFAQLMLFPLTLLIAWIFLRKSYSYLSLKLEKSELPPDMILLIKRVYSILVLVVVFLVVLDLLQVPLAAFAFVSGAIAIGVGFGAQNIINNFISGWILMWEKPIRIGDFLEIADVKGTVETINTRSTRIRRVDGVHLLIPNSQLLENTVVNWTLMDNQTRGFVRVGVAYGSPVNQVSELILKAAVDHPDTRDNPKPEVFFEDFGDNALIFDVYFWVDADTEGGLRKVKSAIRFTLSNLLEEAGIVIAFPQRDIHVDGELRLSRH